MEHRHGAWPRLLALFRLLQAGSPHPDLPVPAYGGALFEPGSVGEYGWAGVGKTYFWVDPVEEIIGILMAQSMMQFDMPERDLQVIAYSAIL